MDKDVWYSKQEMEIRSRLSQEEERGILWGMPEREPLPWDNVKLAWVVIDGKREMLGVDNETLEGFELEDKWPTFKKPLVPKAYDSFERWCTTFDV